MTHPLDDKQTKHTRGPERIDEPDARYPVYFAEWTWHTDNDDPDGRIYAVSYRLWRATMWVGDEPEFVDDGDDSRRSKPMLECKPFMDGFRKWDGCNQWHWRHDMHEDDVERFEELIRAVRRVHVVAAEIMGETWDGGTR